mgnify:CR=1 FL=1
MRPLPPRPRRFSRRILRSNETFNPDLLVQFEVMMATAELWDADNIGVSELPAWEATQDVLIQMEFIPGPIDLEAAFTNAFLPAQG